MFFLVHKWGVKQSAPSNKRIGSTIFHSLSIWKSGIKSSLWFFKKKECKWQMGQRKKYWGLSSEYLWRSIIAWRDEKAIGGNSARKKMFKMIQDLRKWSLKTSFILVILIYLFCRRKKRAWGNLSHHHICSLRSSLDNFFFEGILTISRLVWIYQGQIPQLPNDSSTD